jgi:transcriptional antiterminator RfaH
MPFWGIAQTESQRETYAAYFLDRAGFDIYLPRIRIKRLRKERTVPLFPSYIFIRIVDQWHVINSTIAIQNLIMSSGTPARIRDEELNKIRSREVNGIVKLPKAPNQYSRGDRLMIAKGSFRGHVALFEGMSAHDRVAVLMDLLGRKVKLDLAIADVTPATQQVVAL